MSQNNQVKTRRAIKFKVKNGQETSFGYIDNAYRSLIEAIESTKNDYIIPKSKWNKITTQTLPNKSVSPLSLKDIKKTILKFRYVNGKIEIDEYPKKEESVCLHKNCVGCKNGTCSGVHMISCPCKECIPRF